MIRYLIDTGIFIDHLNGSREARDCLARCMAAGQPPYGSVMTRVEILAGMLPVEEDATRELLGLVRWVSLDETIADRAGELARSYRRRYPGVDLPDYVIAATAELLGATLVTLNIRHFPMTARKERPY